MEGLYVNSIRRLYFFFLQNFHQRDTSGQHDENEGEGCRDGDDLQRFQTELADVKVTLDTNLNVDGFLRFADYFFDGLIADWAVKDRIGRSKEQLQRTRSEIGHALRGLENMLNDNVRACEDARRLRRRILLEAEVE